MSARDTPFSSGVTQYYTVQNLDIEAQEPVRGTKPITFISLVAVTILAILLWLGLAPSPTLSLYAASVISGGTTTIRHHPTRAAGVRGQPMASVPVARGSARMDTATHQTAGIHESGSTLATLGVRRAEAAVRKNPNVPTVDQNPLAAPLQPAVDTLPYWASIALLAMAGAVYAVTRNFKFHRPAFAAMSIATVEQLQKGSYANNHNKPVCVITGANSGVGKAGAIALMKRGWFVIMADRNVAKSELVAKENNFPKDSYDIFHCDLSSFDSTKKFVAAIRHAGYPVDAVVANAAVYLPTGELRTNPQTTADGYELSIQTNHLSHFYLENMLLHDLKQSKGAGRTTGSPRMIILGSVTGNANTLAGQVKPVANVGDLSGLLNKQPMVDNSEFDGAKAYKDSKVCNMLTMKQLHERYHQKTGIVFASLYPGCVATTNLFRNHVPLFRKWFPTFQQKITKGFVSEEEAGERLATVVADPEFNVSGAYWSWKQPEIKGFKPSAGGVLQGSTTVNLQNSAVQLGQAYQNEPSADVSNPKLGELCWNYSVQALEREGYALSSP